MKTTVNVLSRNIMENKIDGGSRPVICVIRDGVQQPCRDVEIKGPSRLVYRPDAPLPENGAAVWVETEGEVAITA